MIFSVRWLIKNSLARMKSLNFLIALSSFEFIIISCSIFEFCTVVFSSTKTDFFVIFFSCLSIIFLHLTFLEWYCYNDLYLWLLYILYLGCLKYLGPIFFAFACHLKDRSKVWNIFGRKIRRKLLIIFIILIPVSSNSIFFFKFILERKSC